MHHFLTASMPAIVFTDLDGTLLDHHSYSYEAALPALKRCRDLSIPVIPCSSKTKGEILKLMDDVGLDGPFIFENGAGLAIPQAQVNKANSLEEHGNYKIKSFAPPRAQWQTLLKTLKDRFGDTFESFSEMSIARLVELTGLKTTDAALAAQRIYSEPVKWHGTQAKQIEFVKALRDAGANPLIGGRFIHVSADCDKGKAMTWLIDYLSEQNASMRPISIALGDGHNDIDMLEVADYAVRIPSPTNPLPPLKRTTNVIDAEGYGPVAWQQAIHGLLDTFTQQEDN